MFKSILATLLALKGFVDPNFNREIEREKIINAIKSNKPSEVVVKSSGRGVGPKEKAFVDYYVNKAFPLMEELRVLDQNEGFYYVAIDRALYNDQAERDQWKQAMINAANRINEIKTSPEYKSILKDMNDLAQGLRGKMAQLAIEAYEYDERYGSKAEHKAILDELVKLDADIKEIANNSPVKKHLEKYGLESDKLEKKVRAGKITVANALKKQAELEKISRKANGQYIAVTAEELLNRQAILRTQLAQMKGFNNWAEFAIGKSEKFHAEGYRTPNDRIAFIESYLKNTKEIDFKLIELIAEKKGLTPEILTSLSIDWLLPETATLIKDFFPRKQVIERWTKAMQSSGFKADVIDNIVIDSFPRKGKHDHAYMYPIRQAEPLVFTIDPEKLEIEEPGFNWENWRRPAIYIVQSIKDNGPLGYKTVWHEGGHGLDYSSRVDVYGYEQDSGYAETHSMMMEHQLLDKEYLTKEMKNEKGQLPSDELVDEYVRNFKTVEFVKNRRQYFFALYDIAIWNQAYTENGPGFVTETKRIFNDIQEKYFYDFPTRVSAIEPYFGNYATAHFYGGSVRYIGYLYADIAAEMSNTRLLDLLEQKTGRRTWHNQKLIADILIEGYYKKGFTEKFPYSIENFVLAEYSPDEKVRADMTVLEEYMDKLKLESNCQKKFSFFKK